MFRIVICDSKKENVTYLNNRIRKALADIPNGGKTEILTARPDFLYDYKVKDDNTYIFFLDVIYEDISGIDIAGKLRSQHRNTYIIFWTRHIELMYMVVNQNLMPSGFIDKRVNENELKKILITLYDYCKEDDKSATASITISTGSAVYKIKYDEIIYIEALNKKINIYTDTQRISCYDSLQNLSAKLGDNFIRCHKSYIINKAKVKNIFASEMYVEMINGCKITMSRSYKAAVKEALLK